MGTTVTLSSRFQTIQDVKALTLAERVAAFWQKFLFEFCKVSVVCWNGEPNWFGWIVIGVAAFIVLGIILRIVAMMAD